MNLLVQNGIDENEIIQIQFYRCSSQSSNSTQDSRGYRECQSQLHQNPKQTSHFQNQFSPLNQIEQQGLFHSTFDISIYIQKRKDIMEWLQSYGEGLNMSRNSLAATQYYADMYYHNYAYDKKQVKYVLISLLILSSKYFDYQKLYTSDIAQCCQLDLNRLNQMELLCSQKLGFNFLNNDTYAFYIDNAIRFIRQQTRVDLYQENQEMNLKLTIIYKICQKIFCEFYGWVTNDANIWYIIQSAFEDQITNDPNSSLSVLIKLKTQPTLHLSENSVEYNFIKKIKDLVEDWRKSNQSGERKKFQNRQRNQKYRSYSEYSIKYTK